MIKNSKQLFNEKEILDILDRAAKDTAQKEARSFRRGVETWKTKVSFRMIKDTSKNGINYKIVTDSLIWKWVNFGTKPHRISAKNTPNLKYQSDFTPKTRAGFIGSRDGGKFGNNWVVADSVMHSGIEARRFDKEILKKADKRFLDSVLKELDKRL